MSDLREGLDDILLDFEYDGITRSECAEKIIAYLRQHDGHAEFVRKVREVAERAIQRAGTDLGAMSTISAFCDAELAKEQP